MGSRARRIRVGACAMLLLAGCAGGDTGDIDISVDVDRALGRSVEVVSAVGHKPGERNAVETTLEIRNLTGDEVMVYYTGRWHDDRGRGFGGQSSSLKLLPGLTQTIHDATRTRQVSRLKVELTAEPPVAAAVPAPSAPGAPVAALDPAFPFTERPRLDAIPARRLRGSASGRSFVAGSIFFIHDSRKRTWQLEIWDRHAAGLADLGRYDPQRQMIVVELDEPPGPGRRLSREMAYGGGLFQILGAGKSNTTSWNSRNAWVLELSAWNVRKWDPAGDPDVQQLGTAGGKLAVCYAASGGFADSCVAGTFQDAVILVAGPP